MTTSSPTSRLPPGLIVNADDLGIHPQISAGIFSAYRNGILTSCTMLMTTAYFEQTVRDYVRPAALPVGLHLSLTLGKAVTPARDVVDLVDDEGNLKLAAGRLIMSSLRDDAGRKLLAQIRREFESQLALARDYGIAATHADSHQHVHMNPAIFVTLEELLPRYGITRLRYCREPFSLAFGPDLPALTKRLNPAKWAVLRWCSTQVKPRLTANDEFFGILHSGCVSKTALKRAITHMSADRSLEVCIHPGFPAPRGPQYYPRPGYNDFISSYARQIEHDILVDADLGDLVRRRGLVLRAFDGRPKG